MQTILKASRYLYPERLPSQELCLQRDSCRLLQQAYEEKKKIASENEELTGIFQFATREFEKKNNKIAFIEQELMQANIRIKELECENGLLKKKLEETEARNNLLNKMLFSKKSEKQECKASSTDKSNKRGAVKGHSGHGRKIPANLPVKEVVIDLPEDEKICPCGKPLEEIRSEEVSWEVGVEKKYYLKKTIRKRYKKTCDCDIPLVTAPLPGKLIPTQQGVLLD